MERRRTGIGLEYEGESNIFKKEERRRDGRSGVERKERMMREVRRKKKREGVETGRQMSETKTE